jgi:serine/threonine protein kinase
VTHGDLKPKNILLKGSEVKICDFGLSNTISIGTMSSGGTILRQQPTMGSSTGGTLLWMAPEVCEAIAKGHNCDVVPPRDIYAFGHILYELVTGDAPFSVMDQPEHQRLSNEMALRQAIVNGARPSVKAWAKAAEQEHGKELVEKLVSLVQDCWAPRPGDRPTADHVWERLNAVHKQLNAEG